MMAQAIALVLAESKFGHHFVREELAIHRFSTHVELTFHRTGSAVNQETVRFQMVPELWDKLMAALPERQEN